MTTKVRLNEGVFGQNFSVQDYTWSIIKSKNNINIETPKALEEFLQTENSTLSKNVLPQIVKIDHAWAYIDQGCLI